MGVKLTRTKKRNLLLSTIYRLNRLLPISVNSKFKLALNLERIFNRIAHESSFKVYEDSDHPVRKYSINYILSFIQKEYSVVDLGCKYGEISFAISQQTKSVVGIEYDDVAIAQAKSKFRAHNLEYVCSDAIEYLKTNNNRKDMLILSHILEHIDHPTDFLKAFAPYFKYIYIEVPDFDMSYLNYYRDYLDMNLIYSDSDHVSEFDREELNTLLKVTGLKVLKAEYRFGLMKI